MSLQGDLRSFSATEILQLAGQQRKSGCLHLLQGTRHAAIWVLDGRITGTRMPGLAADDPLATFLRRIGRLSEEQYRGLVTLHRESGRDLEDLLVNGRYLSAEELTALLERQVFDTLMDLVTWAQGDYRFDSEARWSGETLVSISMEGAIIEAARRVDESRRFASQFADRQGVWTVRDLPDPKETLGDEERELFGVLDGERTLAEVQAAMPLTDFETLEALDRMLQAGWIELSGRRESGASMGPRVVVSSPSRCVRTWLCELAVGAAVIVAVLVLRFASTLLPGPSQPGIAADVHAQAHLRDLNAALALYEREHGTPPPSLETMVEDRWLDPSQLHPPGYALDYRLRDGGTRHELALRPDR
jgi:hypothetical protein